jgi:hypothetical protein
MKMPENEMARKSFQRGGTTASFFHLADSAPLPSLEVTGNLGKEESRDGRSGNDLEIGLTGYDGGIDKRPHDEGFVASLSPLISGKTQVTREPY